MGSPATVVEIRPPSRTLHLPLSVQIKAVITARTRSELESIRELLSYALAATQGDAHRAGFAPGIARYRDAIDTILSVRKPEPMRFAKRTAAKQQAA